MTAASTTTYSYDTLRRTVNVCEGWDGSTCAVQHTPTYDLADRTMSVTTVAGSEPPINRWVTRDTLGRVLEAHAPDGATTHVGHDVFGRVKQVTDADNAVDTYSYDAYGRVVSEQHPGQGVTFHSYPSHSQTITTAPDSGVWTELRDWAGRVTSTEDPDGIEQVYTYAGPLLDEVATYDSTGVIASKESYGYDGRGRVRWRCGAHDPSASGEPTPGLDSAWWYAHDDADRVTDVLGPNDETVYGYDADGLLESESVVGVTTHTYAYDVGYPRLVGEDVSDGSSALRSRDLFWDARGRYVEAETWTEGAHTLERQFLNPDAYGTPRQLSSEYDGNAGRAGPSASRARRIPGLRSADAADQTAARPGRDDPRAHGLHRGASASARKTDRGDGRER